jgi:hypothetical protein
VPPGSFVGSLPSRAALEALTAGGTVGFALPSAAGAVADACQPRNPTVATAAAVSPATNPALLLATVVHLIAHRK